MRELTVDIDTAIDFVYEKCRPGSLSGARHRSRSLLVMFVRMWAITDLISLVTPTEAVGVNILEC